MSGVSKESLKDLIAGFPLVFAFIGAYIKYRVNEGKLT